MMLSAFFIAGVFAQKPEAVFLKAATSPVIGGDIDLVWDDANVYDIDKPYQSADPANAEVVTLPGGASWRGLWDAAGIYLLVEVGDDVYYPWYAPDPDGANKWQFDKPEFYFDVNYVLDDGQGTTNSGDNGHWQVAPDIVEGSADGSVLEENGVTWALTDNGDGSYFAEYFIPIDMMTDDQGIGADFTAQLGFDAYIIDNDDVATGSQQRIVWANVGSVDQAWGNMDNCGLMTLDGYEPGNYVESVSIEDAVIDENNGMVQIVATVLPEDAASKKLTWSIENGTGRATIDDKGVVTAILDGTVTITAMAADGSYEEDMCTVTISNQIVSFPEVNVIKNWVFDDVNDNGTAAIWGGWIDEAEKTTQVIDGVATMYPDQTNTSTPDDPQQWRYQFSQDMLHAMPDVEYEFGFVAWADEDQDDFPVDFEDIPGNNYTRYGATTSQWSGDGRSEWHIPITSIPTKYTMDVTFDQILENTNQKVQFMPGLITVDVYLDSVYLVSADDLALITDYIAVESIVVSGDGSVAVDGTAQMAAVVAPSTALLTDVRWSVVNGTGEATIDAAGMLTGVAAGTVTVVASAKDDSGVSGVMDVTVGGGVGIDQQSVETLKLYPNPAVNELNVVLTSENSTVSIYNSVGQKMDQVVVSGSEYKFDISSYAAGIYFVKTGTSIAKFVK